MSNYDDLTRFDADAVVDLEPAPWREITCVGYGSNLETYAKDLPADQTGDLPECLPLTRENMIMAIDKALQAGGGVVRGIRFYVSPAPAVTVRRLYQTPITKQEDPLHD